MISVATLVIELAMCICKGFLKGVFARCIRTTLLQQRLRLIRNGRSNQVFVNDIDICGREEVVQNNSFSLTCIGIHKQLNTSESRSLVELTRHCLRVRSRMPVLRNER